MRRVLDYLRCQRDPESPYEYLEHIPWDELRPVERCDEPIFKTGSWMRWTSSHADLYDHHLFTDEESFQYCVTNNWTYPNHSIDNEIIFHCIPLSSSQFTSQLPDYWGVWVS
jgi:hypothetical protein